MGVGILRVSMVVTCSGAPVTCQAGARDDLGAD